MMKQYRTILVLVFCLCPLLIIIGCDIHIGGWWQAKYERTVQQQVPISPGSKLYVETSYGSIRTSRPITVSGQISKKKLKGTISEGNGKLHLQTSSDSINLQ